MKIKLLNRFADGKLEIRYPIMGERNGDLEVYYNVEPDLVTDCFRVTKPVFVEHNVFGAAGDDRSTFGLESFVTASNVDVPVNSVLRYVGAGLDSGQWFAVITTETRKEWIFEDQTISCKRTTEPRMI